MQNERLGSSPAEEEVGITAWGRRALVLQNIKPFIPTAPSAGVTPVRSPLCPEQEGVRGGGTRGGQGLPFGDVQGQIRFILLR